MKIAAITRLKQGDLYKALKKLNWSQHALAQACNMKDCEIGLIINLKKRPTENQIKKIMAAFNEAGVGLNPAKIWPHYFNGIPSIKERVQYGEVSETAIRNTATAPVIENVDLRLDLQDAMEKLPPKARLVLDGIYFSGKTKQDLATEMDIPNWRVREEERRGLRLMYTASKNIAKEYGIIKDPIVTKNSSQVSGERS